MNVPLIAVKAVHTVIWALMVACIALVPVMAMTGRFGWALFFGVIVLAECGVLALNRGRCPLTDLAGRYTSAREANFDIFLPHWLARYNKAIFGTLFVAGALVSMWRWYTAK